jgi:hypothetical protein
VRPERQQQSEKRFLTIFVAFAYQVSDIARKSL